ncbi:hypothetical protein [Paenibacillus durus]|uniref:Uncharacterized protein n=1 Tax=Paenibacillus durus TaxID=44251 RepID=A0A089HSW2_PAEDU|nr:hypothetical protein [Paenibacillus durus]AIQ13830.1 hypothetical protein PDUR_19355 [Paenibacillus durus]
MKSIAKWTIALAATVFITGSIWYGANVNAANLPQLKPIGAEAQIYNLNPEPLLKANSDQKERILANKEAIASKFKLSGNNKIESFELKSWGEYNTVNSKDGIEAENTTVDKSRLVWVVKVDFADGYDTRVGHFNNATVTYVIDPETEHVLAQDVKGEQVTFTGGPARFVGKKPVDAD